MGDCKRSCSNCHYSRDEAFFYWCGLRNQKMKALEICDSWTEKSIITDITSEEAIDTRKGYLKEMEDYYDSVLGDWPSGCWTPKSKVKA